MIFKKPEILAKETEDILKYAFLDDVRILYNIIEYGPGQEERRVRHHWVNHFVPLILAQAEGVRWDKLYLCVYIVKQQQILALQKDKEITRLRKWLEYIEGNFSDHREAARNGLEGYPDPFLHETLRTSSGISVREKTPPFKKFTSEELFKQFLNDITTYSFSEQSEKEEVSVPEIAIPSCPECDDTRVKWFMRPGNRPTSFPCPACQPHLHPRNLQNTNKTSETSLDDLVSLRDKLSEIIDRFPKDHT